TWSVPVKTVVGIVLDAHQPMFLVWGPQRTLLYNDSYAAILGNKHPGALGRDFFEVWSEIQADLVPIVETAYAGGAVHMDEIHLVLERHGYREDAYFSFSYTPLHREGGGSDGFLCACNEITRQVSAYRRLLEGEAALRAREAQFRTLAQAVPNQVWTATNDGRLDWFNNKVLSESGVSPRDLAGDGWTRIVHPEDLPGAAQAWAAALATASLYEAEFRIRRADGTYRWHISRAEPVRAEDGSVRWIGTNSDIHSQKTALSELSAARQTLEREVEERTRERNRLWENSQDISVVLDREGRFRAVNPAMTRTLGWLPEEMIGRPVFDFILADDMTTVEDALEQAQLGALEPTAVRYRHKDGGFRWISWVAAPEEIQRADDD
ncbi:MAG: PAS domain S-box protein, partial [Proteobacteria bacterium]